MAIGALRSYGQGERVSVSGEHQQSAVGAALKAARVILVQAGIFSAYVNLLMLTGPIYMLQVYDRILSSRSVETLVFITILAFVLFAAMAGLDFVRSALLARAGVRFDRRIRNLAFDTALDSRLHGAPSPEQPLRDLRQIRQFMASNALTAVFDAPWTPIFLFVVYLMHPVLGLVATFGLIILVSLAFVNERLSRPINQEGAQRMAEAEILSGHAVRGAGTADAMGMRRPLRERWLGLSDLSTANNVRSSDIVSGFGATSKAIRMFLQSAILGTGAYLAIQGEVSPGVMIAASIIAGRALAPMETMTANWRNFANVIAAYRRMQAGLGAAAEKRPRTKLPKPIGALQVDRIYCRPGAAPRPVLKNVSFQLDPGEILGIVGASAAGKSTLARAIVGAEKLVSGEIRIDGANIEHWNRDDLGVHVGFLAQDVELFSGTAAQNIARMAARTNFEDEDVVAAAKAAGAHDMVLGFDDGYDSEIGDNGRNLSAGQRQRLGLARALYGDPSLIVLDEPNSNLDADGEKALFDAMRGVKARGATTIIIAHRASAIAFVDKLLVLTNGQVSAFGARDEVLKQIAPGQIAPFGARQIRDRKKQDNDSNVENAAQ